MKKSSEKKNTWSYCVVCRRNHEEGRKHIFSKHHKTKLKSILSKFMKKVHSARRCLGSPSVLDGELEPGATGKMWCYCCEKEIEKHVTDGSVSIEWGGLLEHMAEQEHHKKTRRFWWENGAETNQLQSLLLFSAEYHHFKELVLNALEKLKEKKQAKIKQLAEDLKADEACRAMIALEPPAECATSSKKPKLWRDRDRRRERVSGDKKRKIGSHNQLSMMHSEGEQLLTSIPPKQIPGVVGNIHTGATPPWLRDDSCTDTLAVPLIGPPEDDFILHRERLKRIGRNPKRVGADFHIKQATQKQPDSDNWLPAFGRVWNHGPRVHSKKEFLRELTDASGPSSTSSFKPYALTDTTTSSPEISTKSHDQLEISRYTSNLSHDHLDTQSSKSYDQINEVSNKRLKLSGSNFEGTSTHSTDIVIKPYVRKRK